MSDGQKTVITVPAAAAAMGVSRIVLERGIKTGDLPVEVYNSGGKNPGFRLIPVDAFKTWLKGREGYHKSLKDGSTKFHPWDAGHNPESIVEKALTITNTSPKGASTSTAKAKKSKKAKAA